MLLLQAISLAGKVRVNAILPGWINTDDAGDGVLRPQDHAWQPVGRVGIPEDVAQMCLFLCDDERAGFITGQEFVVDGGVSKKMVYPG
jgi:NAD(P)-dependent dehydrogenase (short-subunit alcohol dehydrogenase family)